MASTCCALLAASPLLTPLLSLPNTAPYTTLLTSYMSSQEGALHPSCFLSPNTSSQVSTAVSILTSSSPNNPPCQFAIRGHTHMPGAGFANIEGGVVIDMTGLNSVAVEEQKEEGNVVVKIGGGAMWLDVYEFLDAYNVTVPGGRNGDVGVGGYLLGGGISYFGPRVGWGCDNVVNYEIVLPNGTLTNANPTSHPDLHRALKGGGNNFGIITRFDVLSLPFPNGTLISGTISNPIAQKADMFEAFVGIANAKSYDPFASIVLGMTYTAPGGPWAVKSAAIYTNPASTAGQAEGAQVTTPNVYKPLVSIPETNSSFVVAKLSTLSNEGTFPQLNWIFFTATYTASSASLLLDVFNSFNETISTFTIPQGITWSLAWEPLPTVFTQWGDRKGGNVLGTEPGDGNAVAIFPSNTSTDASTNALVTSTIKSMLASASSIASHYPSPPNQPNLHRFQYMNYADLSQDPISSYGRANKAFLRAVSREYDPRGWFASKGKEGEVRGGFKLFP